MMQRNCSSELVDHDNAFANRCGVGLDQVARGDQADVVGPGDGSVTPLAFLFFWDDSSRRRARAATKASVCLASKRTDSEVRCAGRGRSRSSPRDAMSFRTLGFGLAPCRASKVVHGISHANGRSRPGLHRGGEVECLGRWPRPSPQPWIGTWGKTERVGRGEESWRAGRAWVWHHRSIPSRAFRQW